MKKQLIPVIIIGALLSPFMALAVNITVPSAPGAGYGLVSTTTGQYLASTTAKILAGSGISITGGTPYIFAPSDVTISGTGGANVISTTSPISVPQLAYFTGTTPTSIGGVSTSTLTASSPLTGSFTHVGTTGALGCQTASGSQAGCLSSADWTTFNNKISSLWTSLGNAIYNNTGTAVGINLMAPTAPLEVQATTTGGTVLQVWNNTATDIFNVKNTGVVGVGTSNPTDVNANARLTVAGISSQDIIASTTDNTTLSDALVRVYAPGSSVFMGAHGTNQITTQYGITVGGWAEIGAINSTFGTSNGLLIGTRTTAAPIVFGTNSLERMRILSTGNIGIGTTSPFATLSINGLSGGTANLFAIATSSATATTTTLLVDSIGNLTTLGDVVINDTNSLTSTVGSFSVTNTYSGSTTGGGRVGAMITETNAGTVASARTRAALFINSYTGALNNTVNIGGLNPGGAAGALFASQNNSTGYNLLNSVAFNAVVQMNQTGGGDYASTTNAYAVLAQSPAGNGTHDLITNYYAVGATASAPGYSVTNYTAFKAEDYTFATNNTSILIGQTTNPTGNYGIYQATANKNYLAGNVGIGTTTPFSQLSVSTTTQSSGFTSLFAVASTTNATLFNVLGNGNVGVGTTTPGTLFSLGNTGANTVNISTTATSTFGSGLNILSGCYAIGGTCLSSGGITGSGASGQVSYWSGSTALTGSNDHFWDSTNGRLGIGTSSPLGNLTVQGKSNGVQSPFLFLVASSSPSATTTPFYADYGTGHIGSKGTAAPTVSSCGAGAAITSDSTDTRGHITTGASASSCAITFKIPYKTAPFCTAAIDAGTVNVSVPTVTGFTIGFTVAINRELQYICLE